MWVKTIAIDKVFFYRGGFVPSKNAPSCLGVERNHFLSLLAFFGSPLCSRGFDKNSFYIYFGSVYLFRKHVCRDCHTSCPTFFVIFIQVRGCFQLS